MSTDHTTGDVVRTPTGLAVATRIDTHLDRVDATNAPGWKLESVRAARIDELDAHIEKWLRTGSDGLAHIALPRPLETVVHCGTDTPTPVGRRHGGLTLCYQCSRHVSDATRDLLYAALSATG